MFSLALSGAYAGLSATTVGAMKMKIPYFQVAVAILALLGTSLAHGQEKQPLL